MQELVLFIMTFGIVFLIYQLFIVMPAKRRNSKKKPMEIRYLESKYKLDINLINYKRLLLVMSLVSSFDIALVVTIIMMINNYLLEILVAMILILPLILISYHIIGSYYVKKGMIKNG